MNDTRAMEDRIKRLRGWLGATRPGAETKLDRDIIEELFRRVDAGAAAIDLVEHDQLDARDVRVILWAVIKACGGEVKVPSEIIFDKPKDASIARDIDSITGCYVFKAR